MAECFLPADLCEDLLCCVICYEPFTESRIPKALPCLHSLCRPCLKGCISAERKRSNPRSQAQAKEQPNTFPCPLCKEITRIPRNGLDGFKDDFRIRKISEAVAKNRSASTNGDEPGSNNKKCDICRCFNKNSEATSFCLECMKLMCAECSDRHLKTMVSDDHTIVNASYELLQGTTSCEHHPTEEVRYCCRDCQKPMCMTCTFSDEHADHDIVKLSEEMTHIREQIGSLLTTCKQKVRDMRCSVEGCDTLQSKVHAKEKNVCRAILSRTLQEICRTRARQAKMEEEVESVCRERHTELQVRRVKVQEDMEVLDEMCHFADMLLQKGHDAQVASTHSALVRQLQEASGKDTAQPLEETTYTDLGKYEGLIEPENNTDDEEDTKMRSSIVAEMRGVVTEMQMLSTDREGTKGKLLKKIGCTGTAEAQFRFPSAAAFLPNGDLVICDLHNQRVQIFNPDGLFKSQFTRDPFKPCGVAVVGHDIVIADAGRENSCLRVFSADGSQKAVVGRHLFNYPFSVAVNSKGRFVVSDPGVNKIFVITKDNKVERQIDTKTKFGLYLTVNSRDEILLSDWHNHCIKIFDTRGKLIRKIGNKGSADGQLLLPLGVSTDRKDNILVLDCRNSRVSLFDIGGRFLKHVIGPDENLQHSRAVVLSRDHGKLVVTRGDPCETRQVPNEVLLYQV